MDDILFSFLKKRHGSVDLCPKRKTQFLSWVVSAEGERDLNATSTASSVESDEPVWHSRMREVGGSSLFVQISMCNRIRLHLDSQLC